MATSPHITSVHDACDTNALSYFHSAWVDKLNMFQYRLNSPTVCMCGVHVDCTRISDIISLSYCCVNYSTLVNPLVDTYSATHLVSTLKGTYISICTGWHSLHELGTEWGVGISRSLGQPEYLLNKIALYMQSTCTYVDVLMYTCTITQDDPMKGKMQSFLMSSANQQEVAALDQKVRCARVYVL